MLRKVVAKEVPTSTLPVTWEDIHGNKVEIGRARCKYDFATNTLQGTFQIKQKYLNLVSPTIVGGISIDGLDVLVGDQTGEDNAS